MEKQSVKHKAWKRMESLLDSEMPRKNPRIILYRIASAASIVFLAGFFAYQITYNNGIKESSNANEISVNPIFDWSFNPLTSTSEQPISSVANKVNSENVEIPRNELEPNILDSRTTSSVYIPENEIKSISENQFNFSIGQSPVSAKTEVIDVLKEKQIQVNDKTDKQIKTKSSIIAKTNDASSANDEKFVSNAKKQVVQFITPEISRSLIPDIDMGLNANGQIGLVSKNFQDYGLRLGLELNKPLNQTISINSGLRYSAYKEMYRETYQLNIPEELQDQYLVESMSGRDVSRSFVEIPLYADFKVTENFKLKGGTSVTYNKNNSEAPILSSSQIVNSAYLSPDTKREAGKLYSDRDGYLGEFLVGASIEMDKISFDLEGTRGFINSQDIENRNVIGVRINYRFGK